MNHQNARKNLPTSRGRDPPATHPDRRRNNPIPLQQRTRQLAPNHCRTAHRQGRNGSLPRRLERNVPDRRESDQRRAIPRLQAHERALHLLPSIALYHLRQYLAAHEDLVFARYCVGIYKEEAEVEKWIKKVEFKAEGSPYQPAFGRNRTPVTGITPLPITPATPATSSSRAVRYVSALAGELGSALGSAFRSARWNSSSRSNSLNVPSSSAGVQPPSRRGTKSSLPGGSPSGGYFPLTPVDRHGFSLHPPQLHVEVPSIGPVPKGKKRHPMPDQGANSTDKPETVTTPNVEMPKPHRQRSVRFEEPRATPKRRETTDDRGGSILSPGPAKSLLRTAYSPREVGIGGRGGARPHRPRTESAYAKRTNMAVMQTLEEPTKEMEKADKASGRLMLKT